MNDLDRIDARLDAIEAMLRQLLGQQTPTLPPGPAADIRTEIAMVRAAGGDLVTHFKEKARKNMRRSGSKKEQSQVCKRATGHEKN